MSSNTSGSRLLLSLDRVEKLFRRLIGGYRRHTEPVEIKRAIVQELVDKRTPAGNGRFVFPFAAIEVFLAPTDQAERASFQNIIGANALHTELMEELRRVDCQVTSVRLTVDFSGDRFTAAQEKPYLIDYSYHSLPGNSIPRPRARLRVLEGTPNASVVEIIRDRTYIGRSPQLSGPDGALLRRNDLFFSERDVSRAHANVDYANGKFRVFELPDGKGKVLIFRNGESIRGNATLGTLLRTGDELCFGPVRVIFELMTPPAPGGEG